MCALLSFWARSKSYLQHTGHEDRHEVSKRANALDVCNAVFVVVCHMPPEMELIIRDFIRMVNILSL